MACSLTIYRCVLIASNALIVSAVHQIMYFSGKYCVFLFFKIPGFNILIIGTHAQAPALNNSSGSGIGSGSGFV
jgi:hypothetical protein